MSLVDGQELLAALRSRLQGEGLHIVLPVSAAAFDGVAAGAGSPRLSSLMEAARAAVVVGDGGGRFFQRFAAASADGRTPPHPPDPLDAFTQFVVARAVEAAWGGWSPKVAWRLFYPFPRANPALPFQRVGAAAGLPPPGPLGLQVHPRFGPWWAYRALVTVSFPLQSEAALAAGAVRENGFVYGPCLTQRRLGPPCDERCAARARCPVGTAARYSDDQLAFHMRASLRLRGP